MHDGHAFVAYPSEVASGRRTKSEDLGLGNHEFTPWQIGAVM
jgi:altronate hydrolase